MPKTANLESRRETVTQIAKNYSTLVYAPQLAGWLGSIYPHKDFSSISKFKLHQTLNDVITKNYCGELRYKYSLFKRHCLTRGVVAAFEIKVNKSRADFLTINGHTTSYEIKSTIDNLTKLAKQTGDYLSAFEYNYVIIDEKHYSWCEAQLPKTIGIIIYKNNKMRTVRRARLNTEMKSHIQLQLLTKKELITYFQTCDQIAIASQMHATDINSLFKKALKKRYEQRWKFIVNYADKILPIDLQFFFNTNVCPEIIYK